MRPQCLAVLLTLSFTLSGAELSLSKVSVGPGGAATLELRYAAQGAHIAALQVDLHYDAANLKVIAVGGPAAAASQKVVGSNDLAPGAKRILLMSFTEDIIKDGVVACLLLFSDPAASGTYLLRLTDPVAASPAGDPVGLATIDGEVVVKSGGITSAAAFGQIASGGSWKTTLVLVNASEAPATARLNFWGDGGQPLVLPLTLTGAGPLDSDSSVTCSLEPAAMCVVETEAPGVPETRVGWAELQSTEGVTAFAILRARFSPDRDSEAMFSFDERDASGFIVPYDNSAGFQTGIAVVNRSADSATTVDVVIRDESGNTILQDSCNLAPREHVSFNSRDKYPATADRRGTIEIRSRSGTRLNALGLRFNPSSSFTSVPVIAK